MCAPSSRPVAPSATGLIRPRVFPRGQRSGHVGQGQDGRLHVVVAAGPCLGLSKPHGRHLRAGEDDLREHRQIKPPAVPGQRVFRRNAPSRRRPAGADDDQVVIGIPAPSFRRFLGRDRFHLQHLLWHNPP